MSYIKVLLGGKERGLNFSTLAYREFLKKLDPERFDTTADYAMFWGGLIENHYRKQEPVDFTVSDVMDWVDDLRRTEDEALNQVAAKFQETQEWKKNIEPLLKEPLTKKKPRNTVKRV